MESFSTTLKDLVTDDPLTDPEIIIVMFKDAESYSKCLSELKKHNIVPHRKFKSIHALSFYVKNGDRALREIEKHPSVESVEREIECNFENDEMITSSPSPENSFTKLP